MVTKDLGAASVPTKTIETPVRHTKIKTSCARSIQLRDVSTPLELIVLFTILVFYWMRKLNHGSPGFDHKGCAHLAD